MSRRRYFEEQRSGNGAIYHCVKTEIEPGMTRGTFLCFLIDTME